MTTQFTRGFRLHLSNGHVLDGAAFPSGRTFVIDDPEYGLATAASSMEHLMAGYHGARIEWADEAALTGRFRPTVDTITSDQLDALLLQAARAATESRVTDTDDPPTNDTPVDASAL